ncbi:MAG: hypothetical protein ACXVBB_09450, partial [Isosphaeraceae bacterium]
MSDLPCPAAWIINFEALGRGNLTTSVVEEERSTASATPYQGSRTGSQTDTRRRLGTVTNWGIIESSDCEIAGRSLA